MGKLHLIPKNTNVHNYQHLNKQTNKQTNKQIKQNKTKSKARNAKVLSDISDILHATHSNVQYFY